jgi:hypothetical protein
MITYTICENANAVYTQANNISLDCDVIFNHLGNTSVRFHATNYDIEPHGVEIYNAVVSGQYGPIAPFEGEVVPNFQANQDPKEIEAINVRMKRNALLEASDGIVMTPDRPLPANTTIDMWKTYRQELRDITKQNTFPTSVTWPKSPSPSIVDVTII